MHRRAIVLALLFAAVAPAAAVAAKVTLRNGMVLEGELARIGGLSERQARQRPGEIETTPFILVESGHKRYFVADRQRVEIDRAETLLPFDVFELPQKKSPRQLQVASVGLPVRTTGFSEHGVRTVTLRTSRGNLDIVQAITRIAPEFVTVEGVTDSWWQGIATEALPPDQLAAMLHRAIDRQDPDDRMSVARFYIQAGLYEPAAVELEGIARDFPELGEKVKELDRELRQLRAGFLLSEVRRRQAAGQHRLALLAAESFPTELGFDAEVLRQVEALQAGYRDAREKGDQALVLLGELEAKLEDPAQRAAVADLRPVIREQLDWESLGRLDVFLNLATGLPPADGLALAYSGWVVGSAKATTDLPQALALWRARHLVSEYLRSDDPGRRSELLAELSGLEGVGPSDLEDLVPLLTPWVETPGIVPGRVAALETLESVPTWGTDSESGDSGAATAAGPIKYAVVLPPEYVPTRNYPVVVALRPAEWTIEQAAEFWGAGRDGGGRPAPGPVTRAGYIVVAPEYASPRQGSYGYTAREHLAVLAVIRDMKKRFAVDSDRVFLAGHGMGGDATFDLATSHPDLFAGAVSISGLCGQHVKFYKQNARLVPFYVVNGFLDRNSREVNAGDLGWMMKRGHDVMYCEFIGRGYEYYREELPNVVAWMGRLRRAPDPKEIDAQILRACDDRFYWVTAEGIPHNLLVADVANPRGRTSPRAMTLEARINEGNTITIDSAATRYALRLNGTLIDLEQRVRVRAPVRIVFNDFLVPDAAALLDDLRENGDRQRLYPVRLVIE